MVIISYLISLKTQAWDTLKFKNPGLHNIFYQAKPKRTWGRGGKFFPNFERIYFLNGPYNYISYFQTFKNHIVCRGVQPPAFFRGPKENSPRLNFKNVAPTFTKQNIKRFCMQILNKFLAPQAKNFFSKNQNLAHSIDFQHNSNYL